MSKINVGSVQELLSLELAMGESANALREAIQVTRSKLEVANMRLDDAMAHCRNRVKYWQELLYNADVDDDTSLYQEQLDIWLEKLDKLKRAAAQMEVVGPETQHSLRELEILAERTGRARRFLQERAHEIAEYAAMRLPAAAGSGYGAAPSMAAAPVVVAPPVAAQAAAPAAAGNFGPNEISPTSNYAWLNPFEIGLEGDDIPDVSDVGIPLEVARDTLGAVTRMRPHLSLDAMKPGKLLPLKDQLAATTGQTGAPLFGESDMKAFDLYFGSDAIRLDVDGKGGLIVINGRHRLEFARQLGITSVPVSVSNMARKQLLVQARGEE